MIIPLQTFDVVVAVRIYAAPTMTPEQVERMFDADIKGVAGFPDAALKMRGVGAKATGQ